MCLPLSYNFTRPVVMILSCMDAYNCSACFSVCLKDAVILMENVSDSEEGITGGLLMTVKQKQCLLEYLGYYAPENGNRVNNVDGIWGSASEAATRHFQVDYGLVADGIFGSLTEQRIKDVIVNGECATVDWERVKYFGRGEFMCNCGGKYCDGFPAEPNPILVTVADRVRGHFGAEAFVSSGVRCQQHNTNVGGVMGSRHLTGKAMDFCVSGKMAAEVLEYVLAQPEIRYAYDIDGRYVHMDVE